MELMLKLLLLLLHADQLLSTFRNFSIDFSFIPYLLLSSIELFALFIETMVFSIYLLSESIFNLSRWQTDEHNDEFFLVFFPLCVRSARRDRTMPLEFIDRGIFYLKQEK